MAHHKSAKKRIRRNGRANVRNSQYLTAVRTAIKKLRMAVASVSEGTLDKTVMRPLFVQAQTRIAKAAQKGILHSNNANRRIGRLANLLKKVEAGTLTPQDAHAGLAKVPLQKKKALPKAVAAPADPATKSASAKPAAKKPKAEKKPKVEKKGE